MRKTIGLILVIFCVSVCAVSSYAAEAVVYEVDEAGMTLSLPDDWILFSREHDAKRFVCLNARCEELQAEITVGAFPQEEVKDFSDCSYSELSKIAEAMRKAPKKHYSGWYRDSFIYTHRQTAFVVTDHKQYGSDTFSRQYYTVIEGTGICVTLHSLNGEIAADLNNLLRSVIDSCVFTDLPAVRRVPDKGPVDCKENPVLSH